jgi:protein-S-isoprenylcysteine O-methyltransferase Ste14
MASREVLPPALFLFAMLVAALLHALLPLAHVIAWPWRVVGALPIGAGLMLNGVHSKLFERRGTPIHPYAQPTLLVESGAFRWTRNPMYLGLVLGLVGEALLLGSASPWLIVPAFTWVITTRFIRVEEEHMAARFGPAYADYRSRVRRWI